MNTRIVDFELSAQIGCVWSFDISIAMWRIVDVPEFASGKGTRADDVYTFSFTEKDKASLDQAIDASLGEILTALSDQQFWFTDTAQHYGTPFRSCEALTASIDLIREDEVNPVGYFYELFPYGVFGMVEFLSGLIHYGKMPELRTGKTGETK